MRTFEDILFEKREKTIEERSHVLQVEIWDLVTDEENNVHMMAYRPSTSDFVVWSMYYNGLDERTTYDGFYNGKYDLNEDLAWSEMMRRLNK